MNLLIDGQSRSGKLLLAKTLLASSGIAFQHYSGDIEKLLEAIAFSKDTPSAKATLLELLRLNLVHTFEDLGKSRQLSLNRDDSTYYKKTAFYSLNHKMIDAGVCSLEISPHASFIIHTHDSESFLTPLLNEPKFHEIFSGHIRACISVVRNPPAQILSWINRGYTQLWNTDAKLSSYFRLYKSRFNLEKARKEGVDLFPWYVDKAIEVYLDRQEIVENDVAVLNPKDLIGLSVCFLTDVYLRLVDSIRATNESPASLKILSRHVVFHEDIHDTSCANIEELLGRLGYIICPEKFREVVETELFPRRFGRSSIDNSLEATLGQISSESVKKIITTQSIRYCDSLLASEGNCVSSSSL